jgi:putative acetyltransferase
VRAAFSSDERDGHEEVDIVTATWSRRATPNELELVAVLDGAIVGHVLADYGDLGGQPVVGIAPLAVTPSRQREGIGSVLMIELLRRAEEAELPLVVLLGDPDYYRRFGFEPSGPLNIAYRPVGEGNPHFQVRRLSRYDPSYRGDFTYRWEALDDVTDA